MSSTTRKLGGKDLLPTFVISDHDDAGGDDWRSGTNLKQVSTKSFYFDGIDDDEDYANGNQQKQVIILGPDNQEVTANDIIVAKDGGWGWVVVFAAFMCNFIVDGTCFSFGLMQEEIVNCTSAIPSERLPMSEVAWVGSLLFGLTLLSGPFVASLANIFGFRAVGMAGSIVAACAFVISWFAANRNTCEPNMVVLFIFYGIIGGIGFSLIYVPSIITVGFYFDKRRALATGIAIAGSGCGTFVYAPLVKALIKQFEWHGTLLIQSCIIFTCCIFCALFRPLSALPDDAEKSFDQSVLLGSKMELKDDEFEFETDSVSLPTPEGTPLMQRLKQAREEEKDNWASVNSLDSAEGDRDVRRKEGEIPANRPVAGKQRPRVRTQSLSNTEPLHKSRKKRMSVPALVPPQQEQQQQVRSNSIKNRNPPINLKGILEEGEEESKQHSPIRDGESILRCGPAADRSNSIFSQGRNVASGTALVLSNSSFVSAGELSLSRIIRLNSRGALNKPLYRDDIFFAGSLKRVPEYANNVDAVFTSVEFQPIKEGTNNKPGKEVPPEEPGKGKKRKSCHCHCDLSVLKNMLDFSLLKSPTFLFLATSGFITLLGYPVPFVYLKGLATAKGINEDEATYLISIIGIANTVGRVFCGFIADSPRVNSLIINNVALTVAGVATVAIPYVGSFSHYPIFVTYSCLFGISMACFASLRSILIVELLGLGKLTNAFGLLLLFQGVSAICSTPLGGFLYDTTGSYDVTFYASGSMMLFSAIMCFPLHYINRCERRSLEQKEAKVFSTS